MKNFVKLSAILLVLAVFAAFAGCNHMPYIGPTEIEIPTPEPTPEPVKADAELIDQYLGDWYGIYAVGEASGIYFNNKDVRNDCALRVALDSYGKGSLYLSVNGMGRDSISGSTNAFALCTAELKEDCLLVKGMINRLSVEWRMVKDGALLKLSERYGDDKDYMDIEITLARPDGIAFSGFRPEALVYIVDYGFNGIIDKLGGMTSELPKLTAPEGYSTHAFFDEGGAVYDTPEPAGASTAVSQDGRVTVTLPEGYLVLSNDVRNFVVSGPADKLISAEFIVSSWADDSLSFLLGNTPNVAELYHYTIDGYDFYGTFVDSTTTSSGPVTSFKLCGTNGTGTLIIINMQLNLDSYGAYSYINVNNASFTKLVLGARFAG